MNIQGGRIRSGLILTCERIVVGIGLAHQRPAGRSLST
jgi:hypothetical protein